MQNIYYAVLAVTDSTLPNLLAELETRGESKVVDWLRGHSTVLYGKIAEAWKPFGNRSIQELMSFTPRETRVAYSSQTTIVEGTDPSNPEHLWNLVQAPIQVYLIDAFATYLPSYVALAKSFDSHASGRTHCCVLCPLDAPPEVSDHARKCWPLIRESYRCGRPHRFVQEPDDLENFKYLTIRILYDPTVPDAAVKAKISQGQSNSQDLIDAIR
jgi:hypothetical protein